ncbi:hypothetical protein [Flammeovirga kamogawensis]|uniref:DUF3575 domain-containing protein n=1 Tax=Flammeovirga kamogawensis TaxID=373891 RepID=A0ABX8H3I3_9BACT|nr:hypothetical protein [Flammeovirga kamogawensis]MBB6460144.1 hypothetical protein [Flammeovirga kamogawensis]QWG09957.1 hypothetical protein KM029_19950 [Flammeovirga kamogawensis]TRX65464.1 hypothetical protein EO216_23375 [Flammeovirga kamogawensis]
MKTTLLLLLFFISLNVAGQGKINSIEKDVKTKKSSPSPSTQNGDGKEYDDETMNILYTIFRYLIIGAPQDFQINRYGSPIKLQRYPYMQKGYGRYTRNKELATRFSSIIEFNGFYESKNLYGLNSHFTFYFIPKISLDVEGSFYREEVSENQHSDLGLIHINATYHRFAFTGLDTWFGAGYSRLFLGDGYNGGNFNVGTEIFFIKPISVYTNWYFGSFDTTEFYEGNIDLKWYVNRMSVKLGYRFLKIGTTTIKGPEVGLGITL